MLKNLNVFAQASARMAHSAARHNVIAGNIAHADSPGYRARDIEPFDVERLLGRDRGAAVHLTATRTAHVRPDVMANGAVAPMAREDQGFEETPDGNTVDLEQQMVKSTEVRGTFELATSVYTKNLQFLRMAVGRR